MLAKVRMPKGMIGIIYLNIYLCSVADHPLHILPICLDKSRMSSVLSRQILTDGHLLKYCADKLTRHSTERQFSWSQCLAAKVKFNL